MSDLKRPEALPIPPPPKPLREKRLDSLTAAVEKIGEGLIAAEQVRVRTALELPADMAAGLTVTEYEKLLKKYNSIGTQRVVYGKDYEKPESDFDNSLSIHAVKAMVAANAYLDGNAPVINQVYKAVLNPPLDADDNPQNVSERLTDALRAKQEEIRPETLGSSCLDAQLEYKFIEQHPNMGKKQFSVSPHIQSQIGLISALLKKYDGFVLGDIHTKNDAFNFLANHMGQFKSDGVTTIYTEYPHTSVYDMSETQLKERMDVLAASSFNNKVATSRAYQTPIEDVDDVVMAETAMVLAAKERGIRIVHIDKKPGLASDLEPLRSRVATTNFVMTDNIEADRKEHPQGKYIVFTGMAHTSSWAMPGGATIESIPFVGMRSIPSKKPLMTSNGFISKALNIPMLLFESPHGHSHASFHKSDNPNGPDFYLTGKAGYDDSFRSPEATYIAPKDYDAIAELKQTHGLPVTAKVADSKTSKR